MAKILVAALRKVSNLVLEEYITMMNLWNRGSGTSMANDRADDLYDRDAIGHL